MARPLRVVEEVVGACRDPNAPTRTDTAQVFAHAESVIERTIPLHQSDEAMVRLLMRETHGAHRRVDAVERKGLRGLERAGVRWMTAVRSEIGDGHIEIGHADTHFVKPADATPSSGHGRRRTLPGFMMPFGSSARLMVRMSSSSRGGA